MHDHTITDLIAVLVVVIVLAALNIVACIGDDHDEQALDDDPLAEPPRRTL